MMGIKQCRFYQLLLVCLALLLTSCFTVGPGKSATASSFAFLNTYDMALRDYNAGRIMEARARILAMDKAREDYPQAKKLLDGKVNPARIRLLRYYKAKAKKAEKYGRWVEAKGLYEQAAEFSTKPKIFFAYAQNMDIKIRQKRLDRLLKLRREQDNTWMQWLNAYKPPHGLDAHDVAFERMRERVQDQLEERAHLAYRDARYYLKHDMSGVAYVEAETYLRFMPDSEKGQHLMKEVREAMPKALKIRSIKKSRYSKSVSKKQSEHHKTYSKDDVQKLMRNGEWLKAKEAALLYHRNEGKGADELLKNIEHEMEKAASMWYKKGSVAFRVEHIDQAVKDWQEAVSLQPQNAEYVNALRRAMQLQEHLHLLRSDKK